MAAPQLMTKNLMPAPKSGIDYLSSSHFTISQDCSVTSPSLKSVFKKDYTPWSVSSRPVPSIPPQPAQVLHKDDRFCNEKASETTNAYQFRATNLVRPDMTGVSAKLRATNFKMDRDMSKFDSFNTSHMLDFYPKEFQGIPKSMPKENPMESFIPQGDKEKALNPVSDYRDRFKGHDARTTKPDKAPSMHQVGPPTIIGDGRLHHFDTTHNGQFSGVSLPRVQAFPPPTGTNIPQGDKEKEATMQTVHQSAFRGHDTSFRGPYLKDEVMSVLGRTNFKTHDGHGTFDTYQSTAKDSYQPVKSIHVSLDVYAENSFQGPASSSPDPYSSKRSAFRGGPTKHRNHSDFPEGDMDPRRVSERAGVTTSRFYHDRQPSYGPARIVSGADKRTRSNVWFGEPTQGRNFYDTTTSSTFKPSWAPYGLPSPDMTTRSRVPLDYYANERTMATTWSDFQNPQQGKTLPNPTALENLKNSHIHAPLGGLRQFSTEHLEQYIPKSSERVPIDGGKLQRSTVPLGTLKIN